MQTLEYLKNKYNIDFNQEKMPIEIVGVGRLDLIRWTRELDFQTGVEIGIHNGEYSKLICEINTQMKLFAVDPWLIYKDYRETHYKDQAHMDSLYEETKKRMVSPIKHGKYEIIRKTSMDALSDFKDGSLDFVYIDANHEAPFVNQDIEEWSKKVRSGGIVSGHDYVRVKNLEFAIKDALKEYTLRNNIKPWFVLGRYKKIRKEVRDNTRSWMFVKP